MRRWPPSWPRPTPAAWSTCVATSTHGPRLRRRRRGRRAERGRWPSWWWACRRARAVPHATDDHQTQRPTLADAGAALLVPDGAATADVVSLSSRPASTSPAASRHAGRLRPSRPPAAGGLARWALELAGSRG